MLYAKIQDEDQIYISYYKPQYGKHKLDQKVKENKKSEIMQNIVTDHTANMLK